MGPALGVADDPAYVAKEISVTTAWTHTPDIDDAFFPKLKDVAEDLAASPRDMLAVMMSESGVRADAYNPNGHASGLIQFMPDTLVRLGWKLGHVAFRERMSATDQLSLARRYYLHHKPHLGNIAGLYVATFLPALVPHAGTPSYVLVARGGQLGWAYSANSGFDKNRDLRITVAELEEAVVRNATGPRWRELLARLEDDTSDPASPVDFDLRTIRGVQGALARLGIDPGPTDGIVGPKTRAAILAFQRSQTGLAADGIYGPLTREALERVLKARAFTA